MSDEITFRSDVGVSEIQAVGSDAMVVAAARVSTAGLGMMIWGDGADASFEWGRPLSERDAGLIRFLMRNRHTSPFEHGSLTVSVEAPIFVAREWMRHRTQSFNEESGRYRELAPVFYVPGEDRPVVQVGKPGEYRFEHDTELYDVARIDIRQASEYAWRRYRQMLADDIAREVARMCLPVNIYTSFYATANPLNWLRFLSLRNDDQAMYEIRDGARQVEALIAERWPVTYEAWNDAGRLV